MVAVRVVTSFNSRLYNASGAELLASIRKHLGSIPVYVYLEAGQPQKPASLNLRDYPGIDQFGARLIDVHETNAFRAVFETQQLVIPTEEGGKSQGNLGDPAQADWNRRWFQWFRKVAAQYDLVVAHPSDNPVLTLWMDSDIRVMKSFTADDILDTLRKPIGILRGSRVAPETGLIVLDERRQETAWMIANIWNSFRDGAFQSMRRWDDGYVYGVFADRFPEVFQDFAAGVDPTTHTNSNGHTTVQQILPLTPFGHWLEHDKGLHRRTGVCEPKKRRSLISAIWRLTSFVRRQA